MWSPSLQSKDRGWIRGAGTTLTHHLRQCTGQTQATRDLATSHATPTGSRPRHSGGRITAPPVDQSRLQPVAGPSSLHATWDAEPLFSSVPPSPSMSMHSGFQSGGSSIYDSPDLSDSLLPANVVSRRHSTHSGLRQSQSWQSNAPAWLPEQQKSFENHIARLTASAGLPLSWVDNVEWIDLCAELAPGAKSPSRKTLTRRLLPVAVNELRRDSKAKTKGHNATIQADGWTGENHHHLIAFMITVDGKVCAIYPPHSMRFRNLPDSHCSCARCFQGAQNSGKSRQATGRGDNISPDRVGINCHRNCYGCFRRVTQGSKDLRSKIPLAHCPRLLCTPSLYY